MKILGCRKNSGIPFIFPIMRGKPGVKMYAFIQSLLILLLIGLILAMFYYL